MSRIILMIVITCQLFLLSWLIIISHRQSLLRPRLAELAVLERKIQAGRDLLDVRDRLLSESGESRAGLDQIRQILADSDKLRDNRERVQDWADTDLQVMKRRIAQWQDASK